MKKRFVRVLSLVLCVLMCASILPLPAVAADAQSNQAVSNGTKYRALLIGEYKFPYDVEDDGVAARMKGDVLQMKKLLASVKGGKGGKYAVTYKYNRTNKQIKSLINSTFKGAKSSDVSLFFISTHGVVGERKTSEWAGALLTVNSKGGNMDFLRLSDLAAWLKKVPGKVIVIISSCSSGSAIVNNGKLQILTSNGAANTAAFNEAAIQAFADADEPVNDGTVANGGPFRQSKFYVLTASKHDEESWGWETYDDSPTDSYNYMTYYMRKGVTGSKPADANKNKKITLKELYNYTRKKCLKEAKPFGETQHVMVYPANSSFVIFK